MFIKILAREKKGKDNLFLLIDGQERYLFSQKHKKSVVNYYGKGVDLDKAMDFTRASRDVGVVKTMEKIPRYIKIFELEYGIQVLNITRRKKVA